MLLSVKTTLVYSAQQPCDVLLQIEPSTDATQGCDNPRLSLVGGTNLGVVEAEHAIGLRRWISVGMQLECHYEAQVRVSRPIVDLVTLEQTPRYQLPGSTIQYLMPSRYCQSELFLEFAAIQFEGLNGGALVHAMSQWIISNFTYDMFATQAGASAIDSFASLAGVCRDYAHVLIALVRAAGIPARFVSAYAPDVKPQDFHAVVEVYLEGDWHLVDPTGMAQPPEIVRICVGRDAADASFLTSYGFLTLEEQSVEVQRIPA